MLTSITLASGQSVADDSAKVYLPVIMQADSPELSGSHNFPSISGPELILVASNQVSSVHIPASVLSQRGANNTQSVTFVVNYNPSGCVGAIASWPQAAKTAFNYATTIWAAAINGIKPIEIDACWRTDMVANVLGQASATSFFHDFSNATHPQTFYPVSLANQLYVRDLNEDVSEIRASFNSNSAWYFGTDANPSNEQYDFVSTVLHEIGHGLGFSSSMRVDNGSGAAECNGTNGVGCWGFNSSLSTSVPFAYDRFIENSTEQKLLGQFGNNTVQLGSQLISNNLYFDGTFERNNNSNIRARLYAPNPWNSGSSVSHLNDATYIAGTINALMTHAGDLGEAIHQPGPITLGILNDIGWPLYLNEVYVDVNASEPELGSNTRPFNSFVEGINAVANNGTVWIQPGNYSESLSVRELELLRPMTIRSTGGTVTIGN